jgi:hypothetical protein
MVDGVMCDGVRVTFNIVSYNVLMKSDSFFLGVGCVSSFFSEMQGVVRFGPRSWFVGAAGQIQELCGHMRSAALSPRELGSLA